MMPCIVDAAQDLIKRINPAIGGLQRVCCGLRQFNFICLFNGFSCPNFGKMKKT